MTTRISKEVLERVFIGDMVGQGQCVAWVGDLVPFVTQVAPGDVVDLRIIHKKKSCVEAGSVHIHSTGYARVQPFCQHLGVCGGWQWQHVGYAEQLAAKERLVREKLMHIDHLQTPCVATILSANPTEYYRNKLEFTFSNNHWLSTAEIKAHTLLDRHALGFHRPGYFDKVVDITHCYLQPTPSNAIRNALAQFAKAQGLSFYDFRQCSGLLQNLIIRTTTTGEVMVIVQF